MIECNETERTGQIRAYLEDPDAMDPAEHSAIREHLAVCPRCRARLAEMQAVERRVTACLSVLAPAQPPDVGAALLEVRSKLRRERGQIANDKPTPGTGSTASRPVPQTDNRRGNMQSTRLFRPGTRPTLVSGLIAAVAVFSLVAFPSVRAAADSLLQTFRARSVVFVPVDAGRIEQLRNLNMDPRALFLTEPSVVGEPRTRSVASVEEAAKTVGFAPEKPAAFPTGPTSTRLTVYDSLKAQAQVNLDNARLVLQTLGISDIALPDALGTTPVTADVPPFVEAEYSGQGYTFRLVQGRSPTVTLPEGVELARLGEAGLRVIGMQPEQARDMSRRIDWSSTLVVPFPTGMRDLLKAEINGVDGLLVSAGRGGEQHNVVYWQRGDRFYVLEGRGSAVSNDIMLLVARSVK